MEGGRWKVEEEGGSMRASSKPGNDGVWLVAKTEQAI